MEKLCKDCRKLEMVTISTMEEGHCRNCGKKLKGINENGDEKI